MTRGAAPIVRGDDAERQFSAAGEGRYVLDLPALTVTLDVGYVHRDRYGTLRGDLTIRCSLPGARTVEGVIFSGDVRLSDAGARRSVGDAVRGRARTDGIDWSLLIDELALRVAEAERAGDPAVLLRDVERPGPDEVLDVHGVRLLRRHPAIVFGDGGSVKSYFALYAGGELARRGIRCLVADWELDGADHRDRLERLFGGAMPELWYAKCHRPLVHEVDRLCRLIHQHRIDYLIVDSIGFATAGPPEAAEHALAYQRALRQLRVGSLNIAHVTKAGDFADQRPFGSNFWHQGARVTWFVKADQQPGQSATTIGFINRKFNLGCRLPSIGFEVEFTADRTTFTRVNLADVDALADKMTTAERILSALTRGPQTVAALAEEFGAKVDTVEKTCKRWVDKGKLVRLPSDHGTPTRYGLAETRRTA